MSSPSVLEPQMRHAAHPEVPQLLVLWQHPEGRQIRAIGRLTHDGLIYSFEYTRAAGQIEGFRPLPGLRDLHARYEGTRIPSVFGQRVLDRDRPDFDAYIHRLGLDSALATPWEQIVHSGGERAGDALPFMQVPEGKDGVARARFFANGVRHVPDRDLVIGGRRVSVSPEEHEAALAGLSPGDDLFIELEEGNEHDPCASLVTDQTVPLGWVPQALSVDVRRLCLDSAVEVRVVRVGGPEVPSHQRLVLELCAPAPAGFSFDAEGAWEPLGQ